MYKHKSVIKKDEKLIDKNSKQLIDFDVKFINTFINEIKGVGETLQLLNTQISKIPQLMKPNLFNKDIIKKRLFIDSNSIHNLKGYNTSNYTIDLINKNGIKSGSIGRLTNIINFKLVSCIIPKSFWNVTEKNNKILINYNGVDHTIILSGNIYYTNNTLALELKNKFESLDSSFNVTYEFSKYNITVDSPNTFYFKWRTNYDINKSSAYRLFGFELRDYDVNNIFISDNIPDMTDYYITLSIPEISPKNTINSLSPYNVIEKIPLHNLNPDMIIYQNITGLFNLDEPLFFPISLDKITIQLYDSNNILYDCGNKDNSFEFEYTQLINTGLIDKTKI